MTALPFPFAFSRNKVLASYWYFVGIMPAQLFIFILLQLFILIPAETRLMQSCCVCLYLRHFHTPKIFWTYWQISTNWSLKENQVPTSFAKITCQVLLSQRGRLQCEQAPFQTAENPLVRMCLFINACLWGAFQGKLVPSLIWSQSSLRLGSFRSQTS